MRSRTGIVEMKWSQGTRWTDPDGLVQYVHRRDVCAVALDPDYAMAKVDLTSALATRRATSSHIWPGPNLG